MVKVKDRATREKNYRKGISVAAGNYKDAVEKTSGVIEAAKAGQELYVQKMQDRNVLDRRLAGLNKVTDQDWKTGALNKGVARIAPGMEAGAAKQAQNYEPIAQALEAVNLPPRTADAVTNIQNRTVPVVLAMQRAAGKI